MGIYRMAQGMLSHTDGLLGLIGLVYYRKIMMHLINLQFEVVRILQTLHSIQILTLVLQPYVLLMIHS